MTAPRPHSQPDTESAAFAKAYPHLDLDQIPDPWGRPIFKHSHVRALWEGWFARACLDDRAQCGVQSVQAMAKFILWVMQEGPWDGSDLDGGSIQDKAAALGLIHEVVYDPDLHGDNDYDVSAGEPWFVLSSEVMATLAHSGGRRMTHSILLQERS